LRGHERMPESSLGKKGTLALTEVTTMLMKKKEGKRRMQVCRASWRATQIGDYIPSMWKKNKIKKEEKKNETTWLVLQRWGSVVTENTKMERATEFKVFFNLQKQEKILSSDLRRKKINGKTRIIQRGIGKKTRKRDAEKS